MMNNSTTIQGDGKVTYIPVVVNGKQTKKTNADRIRSMTDEELATKLYLFTCVHVFDSKAKCKDNGCKKCWLDWLEECG